MSTSKGEFLRGLLEHCWNSGGPEGGSRWLTAGLLQQAVLFLVDVSFLLLVHCLQRVVPPCLLGLFDFSWGKCEQTSASPKIKLKNNSTQV